MRSSDEVSQEIDKMEKEQIEFLENIHLADQRILNLQRRIIDLQGEKKEIEITQNKGKHVQKKRDAELASLKREYWRLSKQGL